MYGIKKYNNGYAQSNHISLTATLPKSMIIALRLAILVAKSNQ